MRLCFKIQFYDAIVFEPKKDSGYLNLNRYEKGFDLAHLAPNLRRRLSPANKAAFSLTKDISLDMDVVFSSYTGEINRYFDLQEGLAKDGLVSPLSFSLSVHNAISAGLAIASKNHSEICAISAYSIMENVLLNAYLKLADGAKSVLCIGYDEAVSKEYFTQDFSSAMAVLLVSRGDDFCLSYEKNRSQSITKNTILNFIDNFGNKNEFCCFDESLKWSYKC